MFPAGGALLSLAIAMCVPTHLSVFLAPRTEGVIALLSLYAFSAVENILETQYVLKCASAPQQTAPFAQ